MALHPSNPKDPFASLSFTLPFLGIYSVVWLIIGGPLELAVIAASYSDLPLGTAFVEAFRRLGWQLPLLSGLYLVAFLLSFTGVFACCVGLVFTFPILSNVMALEYLYYFPPAPSNPMP